MILSIKENVNKNSRYIEVKLRKTWRDGCVEMLLEIHDTIECHVALIAKGKNVLFCKT